MVVAQQNKHTTTRADTCLGDKISETPTNGCYTPMKLNPWPY
jgi:hypothetical protein